jgi:hypothetical protein
MCERKNKLLEECKQKLLETLPKMVLSEGKHPDAPILEKINSLIDFYWEQWRVVDNFKGRVEERLIELEKKVYGKKGER